MTKLKTMLDSDIDFWADNTTEGLKCRNYRHTSTLKSIYDSYQESTDGENFEFYFEEEKPMLKLICIKCFDDIVYGNNNRRFAKGMTTTYEAECDICKKKRKLIELYTDFSDIKMGGIE